MNSYVDPLTFSITLKHSDPTHVVVANVGDYFVREGSTFYILSSSDTLTQLRHLSISSFSKKRNEVVTRLAYADASQLSFQYPCETWLMTSKGWMFVYYDTPLYGKVKTTPRPTPTPTHTPSPTPTRTPTPTPSSTPSPTPTSTHFPTPTPTPTPTEIFVPVPEYYRGGAIVSDYTESVLSWERSLIPIEPITASAVGSTGVSYNYSVSVVYDTNTQLNKSLSGTFIGELSLPITFDDLYLETSSFDMIRINTMVAKNAVIKVRVVNITGQNTPMTESFDSFDQLSLSSTSPFSGNSVWPSQTVVTYWGNAYFIDTFSDIPTGSVMTYSTSSWPQSTISTSNWSDVYYIDNLSSVPLGEYTTHSTSSWSNSIMRYTPSSDGYRIDTFSSASLGTITVSTQGWENNLVIANWSAS